MVETPEVSDDNPRRRLIIVVVSPGEDPAVETDPPESFATWEIVAALNRAVQILEEDEIFSQFTPDDDEEES